MPFNPPEPKFRCSKCQTPYPFMLPDGKCPCGGVLVDINQFLKNAEDIWDDSVCDSFPCVIAHEYHRLRELSRGSNIYGVFLQLRDVIETTIKFIILLSVAWGKDKDIKGREDAYEKLLATPRLSIGAWNNAIASEYLVPFYIERVGTPDALPAPLWEILSVITDWAKENKLITWRNEKLGHGAIGFEDDPQFQQELYNKIKVIINFYQEHYTAFSAIQLASNKVPLLGYENARNLADEEGECSAIIDGEEFSTVPFIVHQEHGIYFFDELKGKKRLRMLNYQTGYDKDWPNDYAVILSKMKQDQTAFLQASLESEFLTRAENDFLAKLGSPDDFVEPEHLTKWIKKALENNTSGMFLVEMERGCGKSVYTERLNRRFYGPLELAKDLDVRTYHLGRTQTGGMREFTQGIMEEWNSGFVDNETGPNADLARYAVLEEDREHPENNALNLADYLEKLREFTSSCDARLRKKRILLVLDGLDEISESNDQIWSFLPDTDLLHEGVYILLTSRVAERENLSQKYQDHLAGLHLKDRIAFDADSSENKAFLKEYIRRQGIKSIDEEKINSLISLAENRVLYLTLLCSQYKTMGAVDFSKEKRDEIISTYLNMVEKQYSEVQGTLFRRVLCTLSCLGRYEPLTLKEIAEINNLSSITFALLDVMTDLLPLLRVDRGLETEEGLISSENRFSLRDEDVLRLVKEYIGIDNDLYISNKVAGLRNEHILQDYEGSEATGNLVILSHYVPFIQQSGEGIDLKLIDFNCCCKYAEMIAEQYKDEDKKDEIIKLRELNLLRQIIAIHCLLSVEDQNVSSQSVKKTCRLLSKRLDNLHLYEEAVQVLEYAESLIEGFDNAADVASLYYNLANLYADLGKPKAELYFRKVLDIYGPYIENEEIALLYAQTKIRLARLLADYQRLDEALECFECGANIFEKYKETNPVASEMLREGYIGIADVYVRQGKGDLAEKALREARQYLSVDLENASPDTMCSLAHADSELAEVIQHKDSSDEAILTEAYELLQESLILYTQVSESKQKNIDLPLAGVHNNLGKICRALDNNDESYDHYVAALKTYEFYANRTPAAYDADVAMVLMNLGNLLFDGLEGRADEALPYYLRSNSIYQKLYKENPQSYSDDYALLSVNMGSYYLKWKGQLYDAIEHLKRAKLFYQQLFSQSPSQYKSLYGVAVYNLGLAYQLMAGWNDKDALNYYMQYCRISAPPGITVTKSVVLDFAREVIEEQAVAFVMCPAESMTRQNGWCKESRELLLRLRKESGNSITLAEAKKTARREYAQLSEFNQSEEKKAINLVKLHYSHILEVLSGAGIENGDPDRCCEKARLLRMNGQYPEACQTIEESVVSSGGMTTGTACELFMVLAVSGALRDAIDLVSFLFDQSQAGVIEYDEYVSSVSNLRFILYVCIEEYDGLSIIPMLSVLSEDDNYKVKREDLDVELCSGMYLPIVHSTVANVPAAKAMIKEFKRMLKSN